MLLFVILLIVFGIILTNYASNIVAGTVLVQLVAAIAPELGLNPVPIAMVTILSMFVALLSPAASPYAPDFLVLALGRQLTAALIQSRLLTRYLIKKR